METLDYIELPLTDLAAAREFYGEAFGWAFTDYGSEYAALEDGPCQIGLNATEGRSPGILPVIRSQDLEASLQQIRQAGGTILQGIAAYPGGRRFHFRDPAGLELAVYQPG